jgi:hypothetical protein
MDASLEPIMRNAALSLYALQRGDPGALLT